MKPDSSGRYVPNINFKIRENAKFVLRSSPELFKGKRVVVFAVPGAFTLVCSLVHLPEYEEFYDLFKAQGIDEIYCLAINDAFVLEEWAKKSKVSKVKMLPDISGEFTKALGMDVVKEELGLRSWRYAMIIEDGVIEQMFVESSLQSISKSRARSVLKTINPEVVFPDNILIFSLEGCPHCQKAKELLVKKELYFSEKCFNKDYSLSDLKALSGKSTVPQVFINGKLIGGEDELAEFLGITPDETYKE